MTELENERARQEALGGAPRASQSANRARLWAGLNRYLAAEAEHEHEAARHEREAARHEREAARHEHQAAERAREAAETLDEKDVED